jgi:hypothetical protein
MADSDTASGRWLATHATHISPGDLIRLGRHERRVVDRDYPGAYSPVFTVDYGHGARQGLVKLSAVEIYDPDGSVAARIASARVDS